MSVETFTKEQFEDALPKHKGSGKPLWIHTGLVQGEHEYVVHVTDGDTPTNKAIFIRSSVGADGKSADTGKDSIRLWAAYEYKEHWHPLKKLDRWTTRAPSWQTRMTEKLRELYALALEDSRAYRRKNGQKKQSLPAQKPAQSAEDVLAGLKLETPAQFKPQEKKAFTPSKYQVAIFDFVRDGTGNAVVEAVAGSGKTTTLVKALEFTDADSDVAFVAFNRHIAKELAEKAPEHVHVSTLHSLGFGNIRAQNPRIKVENRKLYYIIKDMQDQYSYEDAQALYANNRTIQRLVSLCKATLQEPTAQVLEALCDRYGLETNGQAKLIFEATGKVYRESQRQCSYRIDYDDMIWLCASGQVPCQKFDMLLCDESQDFNAAQIQMVLNSIQENGRVIAVGDRFQSIYGFRGADTSAIPNLIEALDATTLPLSITYRCPKSHVELAQSLVPHIEAAEWAIEGSIEHISRYQFREQVKPGDAVLCRCNAPLVRPCFSLIREGTKAVILGRDIGQNLMSLVRKVQKKARVTSLHDTLWEMQEYVRVEVDKLLDADKGTRAQILEDKRDTIEALAEGCQTVADLETRIKTVFSDDKAGVVFSTVHKFKGGEAERVYILEPGLMPHPRATKEWELVQESNLTYVAWTRSKRELYFVE